MFLGSITIEQVRTLEPVFAKLTPNGWELPRWLIELKLQIVMRDLS
jgi:hypothetical protein